MEINLNPGFLNGNNVVTESAMSFSTPRGITTVGVL
jgi:hypothetical protein